MIGETSKFRDISIIYNKNGFAIAKGHWNGDTQKYRLACRWHEEDGGIGYPQTFGKPQWMVLPDDINVDILNSLQPTDAKVEVTFG